MKFIEIFGRMFDGKTNRPVQVDADGKVVVSPIVTEAHYRGTTGAAYVTVFDLDVSTQTDKTIYLKNTDGTNSLYYKLLAIYSSDQSVANADTLIAETSLALGTDARMQYNNHYMRLILQVKNNAGAATYEVHYSSKGV